MRKQISMPKMNVNTEEDFFLETSFAKFGKLVPNIQPRLLQVKNDIQSDEPHAEVKRPYMETIGTRGKHIHWNNKSLAKPTNTPRTEKRRVTDKISKNKVRKRRRLVGQ